MNFEEDSSRWSDGDYCAQIIADIEQTQPYRSQESRLVALAFA